MRYKILALCFIVSFVTFSNLAFAAPKAKAPVKPKDAKVEAVAKGIMNVNAAGMLIFVEAKTAGDDVKFSLKALNAAGKEAWGIAEVLKGHVIYDSVVYGNDLILSMAKNVDAENETGDLNTFAPSIVCVDSVSGKIKYVLAVPGIEFIDIIPSVNGTYYLQYAKHTDTQMETHIAMVSAAGKITWDMIVSIMSNEDFDVIDQENDDFGIEEDF